VNTVINLRFPFLKRLLVASQEELSSLELVI
jgi:hypothetical protein